MRGHKHDSAKYFEVLLTGEAKSMIILDILRSSSQERHDNTKYFEVLT